MHHGFCLISPSIRNLHCWGLSHLRPVIQRSVLSTETFLRDIWGLRYLKINTEILVNHWFSMLTLLTFKTTSSQNFWNFSVQISPNNNKLDIFEIYTKRGVGKCLRWTFLTLRNPRKSINKRRDSFGGHPVLLHIFKIKDKKQKNLQNLLTFFGSIYQNVIVLVKLWHIF